jgi:hypothetical protein
MSVKQGFLANAGLGVPQDNAPSSGDGAAFESTFDPNTGQRVPGATAAPVSAIQSTIGGVGDSATGRHDAQSYRNFQARYGGIPDGMDGGISSAGYAIPSGPDEFCTTGRIPADSNYQSTTTTTPEGPLIRYSGAGDDPLDTGQSGGESIA